MIDWGKEENGVTEDEMVGWHHWYEFEQTPEDSEGQGSLVICKESDMTERLNNNKVLIYTDLTASNCGWRN